MMEQLECVVIGAGVIGLSVARELALAGREVVVLEAESAVATHTSSRNSEVIHAGIYYPRGSLKARLCVEGRAQLYAYCDRRGVPYRRIGKLIVACDREELDALESYARRARANGVHDVQSLSRAEVGDLEPAISCLGALYSPSTGIIESHALIMALLADLEEAGGVVLFRSHVASIDVTSGGFVVRLDEGDAAVSCRTLVNAAGLGAANVAAGISGLNPGLVPQTWFAKGHYFTLRGMSPFGRLIYPVAGGGGLGVHVTLDISGRVRFGPDVVWVNAVNYGFDDSRKDDFIEAIQRYYPKLDPERLAPGYTGIRPKIAAPGAPAADFLVQGPGEHGIPGLVNLFGIESPGLTSSLALAGIVTRTLKGNQ